MADIKEDLLSVLAKHGLTKVPEHISSELTKKPTLPDISSKASYIKEIITDINAYNEDILVKVGEALKTFKK